LDGQSKIVFKCINFAVFTHLNLVNINLEEDNIGELSAEPLKLRGNHPARAAPGGGKVHHDLRTKFENQEVSWA
jgi:hypothetical protein